ncbi:MAG: hypothetical protein ACKO6Q_08640 [Bacteroidota bacterium]
MYRLLISLVLLLFLATPSLAQLYPSVNPSSSLRTRTFSTRTDSLQIDTVSLVPNSWFIEGDTNFQYHIDPVLSKLFWIKRPMADSFTIHYRVFPFSLAGTAQRNRYDSVKNKFYVMPFTGNQPGVGTNRSGGFNFGNIRADGSIGRQIGFGNAQDAVVNSTLNLQLSGMLGDSIQLDAAITDNNIPIQPDGTTQQLNEFDQVYIRFQKDPWQLHLGDIDIREDRSHYLRFYKRMQGISFQTKYSLGKESKASTLVSSSIAKGKFTRQEIRPQEGNQGPYRLKGPNGEFFFVVLANTERVYYDGLLMQRGEDQDYVINYNTAEVTFTPKRMITKDSRIQIEFEFAERNYLNTNLFFRQDLEVGNKWKYFLGAFTNSDARNSPINQLLDARQKQFLSEIGDSVQKAFYPTAQLDTFAADKILYEKIYVGLDSFYRYSTNPITARYRLAFTDLGQGQGNYIADYNGANGKVYTYVAPVSGVKQGRYEPIQLLVAPRRQQIINAGFSYKIGKQADLQAEVASSNNDVNTFSSKEGNDDRGWAGKIKLTDIRQIRLIRRMLAETFVEGEWVDPKFRPLERLRSIEFTRDWGLDALPAALFVRERILQGNWVLTDSLRQEIRFRAVHYKRGSDYTGFQFVIGHRHQWNGWLLDNQWTRTRFDRSDLSGTFSRPRLDLSKELKTLWSTRIGINYQLEKNQVLDRPADTIQFNSFYFDVLTAYWRSPEKWKDKWNLQFFTRGDRASLGKEWKMSDRSVNGSFQFSLERNSQRQLYANLNIRKLTVLDKQLSRQKDESTFLGRMEYNFKEWKGLLQGNILYETGTGQEQRRDFSYFEVPAGQGEFAWIDYNNDGIQQLNEFEKAIYPDQAKFLRIYTPTNQFVKANYSNVNYRLDLSPRTIWQGKEMTRIQKFISRWGFNSTLLLSQKQVAGGTPLQNPFGKPLSDTSLINQQSSRTHTLTFNRFSAVAGVDLLYYRNAGKSLLTYGYESRVLEEWQTKARWNLNRSISIQLVAKLGQQGLFTPRFSDRNYDITFYSLEPVLNVIQNTQWRLSATYKYSQKENDFQYGGERAVIHSLSGEGRWNRWQRSTLTGRINYQSINYPYQSNTAVSFMMLEGLLPGANWVWSMGFTKRLINNLEMTLQYDGRKAGNSSVVNLGRAGVTALF